MWSLIRRRKRIRKPSSVASTKNYQQHKEMARRMILERVAYFAPICGVEPKRVAIRNTKRNWGSCSSLGNLNFNYKIALLPSCWRDYIIIHELCHLVHLHHKDSYWIMVGKYCPTFKERIADIRALERTTRLEPKAIVDYVQNHTCSYCEKGVNQQLFFAE